MSNPQEELLVLEEDGLAVLRLNRPERLNALSSSLVARMETEVRRVTSAPHIRAILLTGTGRAFCAGGDVGAMCGPVDAGALLDGMQSFHPSLTALWTSDKLLITAINGVAAGAGFGLALIGDLIVAADNSYFKAAFASLGAAPDFALGFTLPRLVGAARAAEILIADRRVPAPEALAIGMISRVLPAESFASDALELARATARAARGVQLTKRLLRFEQAETFARYLALEARVQTEAFQSQDFVEGVAAFCESRSPHFCGR